MPPTSARRHAVHSRPRTRSSRRPIIVKSFLTFTSNLGKRSAWCSPLKLLYATTPDRTELAYLFHRNYDRTQTSPQSSLRCCCGRKGRRPEASRVPSDTAAHCYECRMRQPCFENPYICVSCPSRGFCIRSSRASSTGRQERGLKESCTAANHVFLGHATVTFRLRALTVRSVHSGAPASKKTTHSKRLSSSIPAGQPTPHARKFAISRFSWGCVLWRHIPSKQPILRHGPLRHQALPTPHP
jgi:hypothetical protein